MGEFLGRAKPHEYRLDFFPFRNPTALAARLRGARPRADRRDDRPLARRGGRARHRRAAARRRRQGALRQPAVDHLRRAGPVAEAAAAAAKALAGDGWRQYSAANANEAKTADVQVMNFKKGPLALNVLVTKSDPATTANVNYTAKPLANDLPFPPDATDIAFDPNQPLLTCASSQPIAATLAFFKGQLAGMGWSPAPAGATPTPTRPRTPISSAPITRRCCSSRNAATTARPRSS